MSNVKESNVLSLGAIMAKYQSKHHFFQAYTAQGKLLIDKEHLSWHYIAEILTGKKKVITTDQLKGFEIPPRLTQQTEKPEHEESLAENQQRGCFQQLLPRSVPQQTSTEGLLLESVQRDQARGVQEAQRRKPVAAQASQEHKRRQADSDR